MELILFVGPWGQVIIWWRGHFLCRGCLHVSAEGKSLGQGGGEQHVLGLYLCV